MKIICLIAIYFMAIGFCYSQTNVKPVGADCGSTPEECDNKEFPFIICKSDGTRSFRV